MLVRFKKDKWVEFTENYTRYSFYMDTIKRKRVYIRMVCMQKDDDIITFDNMFVIITMDGYLHLVTPEGESPFMETHEDVFRDLLNKGFVEYVKGEFD